MFRKSSVSLVGVQWQLFKAAIEVEPVFKNAGSELTITSGTDGKHMESSLHYKGLALDFRTRDINPSIIPRVAASCREVLGPDFDVVQEKDHIHIEFQPKEHK